MSILDDERHQTKPLNPMKLALFREIYDRLGQANTYHELTNDYPTVPLESIQGIYYRLMQTELRRRIWRFEEDKIEPIVLWETFISRWQQAQQQSTGQEEAIIANMAKDLHGIPPCHLARIIVKAYCETNATILSTTIETSSDTKPTTTKITHNKLYREPSLLGHSGLAQNVLHCHKVDEHYSPAMDEYRTNIGKLYEDRLQELLTAHSIPFLDEPAMRRMGYARTPDAILLEPISVNGLIVKWIESKAWFGDPPSHATYLKEQYWPYYNRFGPGLVIYWFGYVEEAAEAHQSKGVAVMDAFPSSDSIVRIHSPYLDLVKATKPPQNEPNALVETSE